MLITTCQICGRAIKAKKGVIAHHGYTRRHGWQTASCLGARFAPYERSRDRIPQVIETYINIQNAKHRQLREMIANPPETMQVPKRGSYNKLRAEFDTVPRPEGFDPHATRGAYRLDQKYEMQFDTVVRNLRTDIVEITEALNDLHHRFNAWVLKPAHAGE